MGARDGLTAHAHNSGDLPRKSAREWVRVMALLRMHASASEQVDAISLNEQRVPETREETCACSFVCNAAAEGRALGQAELKPMGKGKNIKEATGKLRSLYWTELC